ncbi:MAG: peroxiredoxin [Burkholderiales bacterium]|nr:MAG: peroxiredoxin [Burkholderiales bacterium]
MTVTVGKTVPDFTAAATGGDIRLSKLKDRKVVLFFYPKDHTPGCTNEASDFRDLHEAFVQAGAVVLGVSRDGMKSHEGFRTKLGFPFELISDPDETLCELFGVMKLKNMYGRQVRGIERSTFVIDGAGKLAHEWRGVKVPGHVAEVLEVVRSIS